MSRLFSNLPQAGLNEMGRALGMESEAGDHVTGPLYDETEVTLRDVRKSVAEKKLRALYMQMLNIAEDLDALAREVEETVEDKEERETSMASIYYLFGIVKADCMHFWDALERQVVSDWAHHTGTPQPNTLRTSAGSSVSIPARPLSGEALEQEQ